MLSGACSITSQNPRTFGRLAIPYELYFSKDNLHRTAAPCAQCVLSKALCDLKVRLTIYFLAYSLHLPYDLSRVLTAYLEL